MYFSDLALMEAPVKTTISKYVCCLFSIFVYCSSLNFQLYYQVCVAPTASEAYETRCSLNFGTRARKITNKERLILNVEVCKVLPRMAYFFSSLTCIY